MGDGNGIRALVAEPMSEIRDLPTNAWRSGANCSTWAVGYDLANGFHHLRRVHVDWLNS